jgi:hypothetical protein
MVHLQKFWPVDHEEKNNLIYSYMLKWKDNIKTNYRTTVKKGMICIQMDQNRIHWTFVNTLMIRFS